MVGIFIDIYIYQMSISLTIENKEKIIILCRENILNANIITIRKLARLIWKFQ